MTSARSLVIFACVATLAFGFGWGLGIALDWIKS